MAIFRPGEIRKDPVGVANDPNSSPEKAAAAEKFLQELSRVDPTEYERVTKEALKKRVREQKEYAEYKKWAEEKIMRVFEGNDADLDLFVLESMDPSTSTIADAKAKLDDYIENSFDHFIKMYEGFLEDARIGKNVPEYAVVPKISEIADTDEGWKEYNKKINANTAYVDSLTKDIHDRKEEVRQIKNFREIMDEYILDDDVTIKQFVDAIKQRIAWQKYRAEDETV